MSAEVKRSWTFLEIEEAGPAPASPSHGPTSRVRAMKILALALLDVCALWWERYGRLMWPGKGRR